MDFVCEVLVDRHDSSAFDSGQPTLDAWLRGSARDSDGRNLTRTYVWHTGDNLVVGYYTLMPFFIERATLARTRSRGLPDRISGYLVARLALDRSLHGRGLGTQLLASALERVAVGARDLGGRFVVVDAIDDAASSFYRYHGFEPIPGHPYRLVLQTKALASYLPERR
ncbi:MAG: GNAT family N-acetyltransferase [Acidimicrobiales bacterium]